MHTKIAILAALALGAGSLNIHAIGITLADPPPISTAFSLVREEGPFEPRDQDTVVITALPYEFSTFAQLNDSIALATWSFSNEPNEAVFSSSALLIDGVVGANDLVHAATSVGFILTEPVDYAFSGSFFGISSNPDASGFRQSIGAFIVLGAPDFAQIYSGSSDSENSGLLSLPEIGNVGFSSGGLAPGSYIFGFIYDLLGFSGGGKMEMTLSRHPVPDAGSTLIMLGTALCAFGVFSQKKLTH